MSTALTTALKRKPINGWNLFWLLSLPMSGIMLVESLGVDMTSGQGVSHMIGFSVRFAVPLIFLVTAISSLQFLIPGPLPAWLLRNRKYIGLSFAVAMAWQGLFIFSMSMFHRDYYYADIYLLRDEMEGSTGYLFLAAMVITSFSFARRHLSGRQWTVIHRTGLYFLFAYAFSVYWWNLSYYPDPQPVDHVFYWMGFLAFASRIAAWGKKRRQRAARQAADAITPPACKWLGVLLLVFGVAVAATGRQWREAVTGFLTGPQWSADMVLWLPYWPLEPFLSLFIVGFAALLLTATRSAKPGGA